LFIGLVVSVCRAVCAPASWLLIRHINKEELLLLLLLAAVVAAAAVVAVTVVAVLVVVAAVGSPSSVTLVIPVNNRMFWLVYVTAGVVICCY